MALADDLAIDIASLLDDPDYGRDATLERKTLAAYNTSTQTAAKTTASHSVRVIMLGFSTRLIDGTNIKVGDRRAVTKALNLTIVPDEGDVLVLPAVTLSLITIPAERLSVIDVKSISIGDGTPLVYIMQVRKGGPPRLPS